MQGSVASVLGPLSRLTGRLMVRAAGSGASPIVKYNAGLRKPSLSWPGTVHNLTVRWYRRDPALEARELRRMRREAEDKKKRLKAENPELYKKLRQEKQKKVTMKKKNQENAKPFKEANVVEEPSGKRTGGQKSKPFLSLGGTGKKGGDGPKKSKQKRQEQKSVDQEAPGHVEVFDRMSFETLCSRLNIRPSKLRQKFRAVGFEGDLTERSHPLPLASIEEVLLEMEIEPLLGTPPEDLAPRAIPNDTSKWPARRPVVTVMGHVDHGKTSLLDALRDTSVAAGEAGGITQHIGAFSVQLPSFVDGKHKRTENDRTSVTFLDTPGHAAFSEMRRVGSLVTDLIVLVVAADDGVMPQTKEVIQFSKQYEVPVVVAINKCDKTGVDVDRVKRMLQSEGVVVEDLGGEVQAVEISALRRKNLDLLVEALVAQADVLDLRADVEGPAEGYVIESATSKKVGNSASVVVRRGILKMGDYMVCGTEYCRVRGMHNDKGKPVKKAKPGDAVEVLGFSSTPPAGEVFLVAAEGERKAIAVTDYRRRTKIEQEYFDKTLLADDEDYRDRYSKSLEELDSAETRKRRGGRHRGKATTALLRDHELFANTKQLNLILRGDVVGSVEALHKAVSNLRIPDDSVTLNIMDKLSGPITEADLDEAKSTEDSLILGFNVDYASKDTKSTAMQAIDNKETDVYLSPIIYRHLEYLKKCITELMPWSYREVNSGTAEVKQLFKVRIGRKERNIAGCVVTSGYIAANGAYTIRTGNGDRIVKEDVPLTTMKQFNKPVERVEQGEECGLVLEGFDDVVPGHTLHCRAKEPFKPEIGDDYDYQAKTN
eukprot:Clim_evm54s232 gene=Clim_evmTU54s232